MEGTKSGLSVSTGIWNPVDGSIWLDQATQNLFGLEHGKLSPYELSRYFEEADRFTDLFSETGKAETASDEAILTLIDSAIRVQVSRSSISAELHTLSFVPLEDPAPAILPNTYKTAVTHAHDIISLTDTAGYLQYLSPSVYKILGYWPDELYRANPYERLFHEDEIDFICRYKHRAVLEGEHDIGFQHRLLNKQNHYQWFESYINPVKDDEGHVVAIHAISREITHQKETEVLLDETNQIALVGGWQYFPATKQMEWTPETYRLFELPVNTPVTLEDGIHYFHPDYQNHLSDSIDNLLRTGESYDLEAPIITAKGQQRWVRAIGTPVWNNDGAIERIRGVIEDITDQKTIQRQLRKQEVRNQQLVETVQDIIFWLDADGYFIDINPYIYTVTGYSRTDLRGTHFSQIIPDQYQGVVEDLFQEVISTSNPRLNERIPVLTVEQRWRWVDLSIQRRWEDAEIHEVFGIARDVTNQAQAQERLAKTSKRLETLIENLQTGILLEDEQQQVYLVNEHFCKLFGLPYNPSDLSAASCQQMVDEAFNLFKSPSPKEFRALLDDTVQNRKTYTDYEVELTNGRTLSMDTVPIYHEDQYLGHLWQYHDITEQKQEAHELRKAKEEADKASRAQADFLSTMSHEIRTPLNSVIGIAHILLDQDPKPDQLENLRALKFSGENLLNLINDILDFNKIEAGKIDLESRPFDLHSIVKGVQQTHSFKAEEKNLSLNYQYDDRLSQYLKGDPTRISQIINNLVSNAIKFTTEGSVTIEVQQEASYEHQEVIYFAVTDTGPGIPEKAINEIFKSFTQASNTTTRNHGGTGLGLSITQRLLNLYGSQLQVSSEEGKGTRFYFTLTFDRANKPPELSDSRQTTEDGTSISGYHILMAEDNELNTFMASQFLNKWGVSITIAENGREAIQAAATSSFDLILMDLQMPEMDGYQATEQIRQLPGYSNVPIVALTASVFAAVEKKITQAGMNDHLTKPFNPSSLYQKLLEHLEPADS